MSAIAATASRARSQAWAIPLAAYAAAVGYLSIVRTRVGGAAALLPAAIYLMLYPWWAVVAAAAVIPLQQNIAGGSIAGLNVSASDVLIVIAACGFVPLVLTRVAWRAKLGEARGVLLWMLPFAVWLGVVVIAHPAGNGAANAGQYLELSVVAVALSTLAFTPRLARVALGGFIGVTGLTAIFWITHAGAGLQGDKNPAGQFMVDALLLSLTVIRNWRARLPVVFLLVVGILYSESRGAVLGAAIGALVLLAFRGLGSWRGTIGTIVPLAAVCIVGFNVVPASLQARVQSTFTSVELPESVRSTTTAYGTLSPEQYTVQLRSIYRREGLDLIKAHPWVGVGIGNYLTGDPIGGTLTNDPHNVLILEAAEGGVPDMALFLVMIIGTGVIVIRRARQSPWAGPALAVQAAIFSHGLVDVYWVRGTPLVGWILVGMAVNRRLDYEPAEEAPSEAAPVALPA